MRYFLFSVLILGLAACSSQPVQRGSEASPATGAVAKQASPPAKKEDSREFRKREYSYLTRGIRGRDEAMTVAAASKLLAKNANDTKALNGLGVYYLLNRKPHLAKLIFLRLLEKNSKNATWHNNLGLVFESLGEEKLAMKEYELAIDLKPKHPEANANLGYHHVKYGNYSQAKKYLERAYEAGKTDFRTANNYAIALRGIGEIKDAEKVYKKSIGNSSRNVSMLMNYAILLVDYKKDKTKGREIVNKIKFLSNDAGIMNQVSSLEKRLRALK